MKVRKKVLALLLAAVTTLSMGVTAFATGGTGETTYTDQTTVTIKKEYVAANADTTSPTVMLLLHLPLVRLRALLLRQEMHQRTEQ